MARLSTAISRLQPLFVPQTSAKPTASVIFLHGSGDTGEGIRSWLKIVHGSEFSFPHVRVIYPTAPVRPYTPNNGLPSTVWFDRQQISPQCPEDMANIDDMCSCLDEIVSGEIERGISHKRIIIGGFSMGGALALHYGYRHRQDLAGVIAMSSFLNNNSAVYDALKSASVNNLPPLFQAHGARDQLVLPEWGDATHQILKQHGVSIQYTVLPNLFHEFNHKEVDALSKWIWRVLPQELPTNNS